MVGLPVDSKYTLTENVKGKTELSYYWKLRHLPQNTRHNENKGKSNWLSK